jgi:hypothetical protein
MALPLQATLRWLLASWKVLASQVVQVPALAVPQPVCFWPRPQPAPAAEQALQDCCRWLLSSWKVLGPQLVQAPAEMTDGPLRNWPALQVLQGLQVVLRWLAASWKVFAGQASQFPSLAPPQFCCLCPLPQS